MVTWILILRVIHILAGVIWVGGTLIMTFVIAPAAGSTGEAGQKFLDHVMNKMKFGQRMAAAAGLTILAGFALFWIDSNGFTSAWMSSGAGRNFGIGAGFAIVGFVFGVLVGIKGRGLAKLGAESQGKPSTEQGAQMQTLAKQLKTFSISASVFLIISVFFMSIARFS